MAPKAVPASSKKTSKRPADFNLLKSNLGMAGALEEFLVTTYGPGGRGKLIRDDKGKPLPTFNGAKMLDSLDGKHPTLSILRRAAKDQEDEWGDGTKLAALLALRLLRRSEELLGQGLHPHHILEGYDLGLDLASRRATDLSVPLDPEDGASLEAVARSSLGNWITGQRRDQLAAAIARAAQLVKEPTENKWRCDRSDIHVFALPGSALSVELIHGYVLKRFPDYHEMPKKVENAHIALFDAEPKRGKAGIGQPKLRWAGESKILLRSPKEIEEYTDWADDYTEGLVEGLRSAGANVVLCRLGISDLAHKLLADAGMMGIRRIMKTVHMDAVARATGGSLIKDFREVRSEDLGRADLVEEREYGAEKYLVITGCANPRVASMIIQAPGDALVGQYEEQVRKAVGYVAASIENPSLVLGGGALEMAASRDVLQEAPAVAGRSQLGIQAFGRALEDVTTILATNMGLDALDTLVQLRHLHSEDSRFGLLSERGKPADVAKASLLEPLAPHLAAWRRSVDVCRTILRADDFLKASRKVEEMKKEEEKTGEEKKRYS